MRAALYGRVSTSDKDQDPETQLMPLREFVKAQGWKSFRGYVDQAPATDLLHRTQWRELLDDGSKRRFDLLLVWRMDRAFRSVLDAATTLERLRTWGVGLRSYSEPWLDTTSPFGEALHYITVAYAQLERGILRERVKAERQRVRERLRRLAWAYVDGLFPDEEYHRQRRLLEMELESLVVPQANAAAEAGKLIVELPRL